MKDKYLGYWDSKLGTKHCSRLQHMNPALRVYFLLAVLYKGHALECFSCASEVSWEDCEKNIRNGTCAPYLDNCAKLYARGNGEVFARGCETSDECFNKLTCKGLELNECNLHCCKENFCNRSAAKKTNYLISVLSLVTSIIAKYCHQLFHES